MIDRRKRSQQLLFNSKKGHKLTLSLSSWPHLVFPCLALMVSKQAPSLSIFGILCLFRYPQSYPWSFATFLLCSTVHCASTLLISSPILPLIVDSDLQLNGVVWLLTLPVLAQSSSSWRSITTQTTKNRSSGCTESPSKVCQTACVCTAHKRFQQNLPHRIETASSIPFSLAVLQTATLCNTCWSILGIPNFLFLGVFSHSEFAN